MEYLAQLTRHRAVVGVGRHDLAHVAPPTPADLGLERSPPSGPRPRPRRSRRDRGSRGPGRSNRSRTPCVDQRALEIGPDRAMAPLVFGLLARVYRHAKRLANHVRIIAGRSRIVSSKVDSPLGGSRSDGERRRRHAQRVCEHGHGRGARRARRQPGRRLGRPGQAPLRHRRHRCSGDWHVGPADPARLSRPRRDGRVVRHQPAARRSREETDGRVVPDLHQLRRDAHEGEARRRDGDDRRRVSQPVPGARDGARRRRDDRKADGHRRGAVPRRARRREKDRPQRSSSPTTTATRPSTRRSRNC